jgi:hypothetical protein
MDSHKENKETSRNNQNINLNCGSNFNYDEDDLNFSFEFINGEEKPSPRSRFFSA